MGGGAGGGEVEGGGRGPIGPQDPPSGGGRWGGRRFSLLIYTCSYLFNLLIYGFIILVIYWFIVLCPAMSPDRFGDTVRIIDNVLVKHKRRAAICIIRVWV